MMKQLLRFFAAFALSVAGFQASAEVLKWDSRIPLTPSKAEYVAEAAARVEGEWEKDGKTCLLKEISGFELTQAEFMKDQVLRFVIASKSKFDGACPGRVLNCETEFTWLGPKDWDLKTACEEIH